MNEALLDVRKYWRMSTDMRRKLHCWAQVWEVPIGADDKTFALVFGEGRVTVFQYETPIRLSEDRTEAVKAEPFILPVGKPPPMDVLRWAMTDEPEDVEGVPTMGTGQWAAYDRQGTDQ